MEIEKKGKKKKLGTVLFKHRKPNHYNDQNNIGHRHMGVIICISYRKSYFDFHRLNPDDVETSDQGSSPPETGPENHDRLCQLRKDRERQ